MHKVDITTSRKQKWRKIGLVVVILVVLLAAVLFLLHQITLKKGQTGFQEELTETQQRLLVKVEQDYSAIKIFCDQDGKTYYVTVQNSSPYIFSGNIELSDENNKVVDTLTIHLLKAQTYQYRLKSYETAPVQSAIPYGGAVFYDLNYQQPTNSWQRSFGSDDAGYWQTASTPDSQDLAQVKIIATRIFLENYLTDPVTNKLYILPDKATVTSSRPTDSDWVVTFNYQDLTILLQPAVGTEEKIDLTSLVKGE